MLDVPKLFRALPQMLVQGLMVVQSSKPSLVGKKRKRTKFKATLWKPALVASKVRQSTGVGRDSLDMRRQKLLLRKGASMYRISIFLVVVVAMLTWTMPATAVWLPVYSVLEPGQDLWPVHPWYDEKGDQPPFPDEESLISSWQYTDYRPCPINEDDPLILNVEVTMTNTSGHDNYDVIYVADEGTSLQNYDKPRIGNGPADVQL